eukprot:15468032-Alexandrium_andersonii.AAC.1
MIRLSHYSSCPATRALTLHCSTGSVSPDLAQNFQLKYRTLIQKTPETHGSGLIVRSSGGVRPPTADHQTACSQPGDRSRQFRALFGNKKRACAEQQWKATKSNRNGFRQPVGGRFRHRSGFSSVLYVAEQLSKLRRFGGLLSVVWCRAT